MSERVSINVVPTLVDAQYRLGFDSRDYLIDLIEHEDVTAETVLVPALNCPQKSLEIIEVSGRIDIVSDRWRR